jgi:hypothetical protein
LRLQVPKCQVEDWSTSCRRFGEWTSDVVVVVSVAVVGDGAEVVVSNTDVEHSFDLSPNAVGDEWSLLCELTVVLVPVGRNRLRKLFKHLFTFLN